MSSTWIAWAQTFSKLGLNSRAYHIISQKCSGWHLPIMLQDLQVSHPEMSPMVSSKKPETVYYFNYHYLMQGWASKKLPPLGQGAEENDGMGPLLDLVVKHVPPPAGNPTALFSMLVAMVEHDDHLGKVATGRVHSGSAKIGDKIKVLHHAGEPLAPQLCHQGFLIQLSLTLENHQEWAGKISFPWNCLTGSNRSPCDWQKYSSQPMSNVDYQVQSLTLQWGSDRLYLPP